MEDEKWISVDFNIWLKEKELQRGRHYPTRSVMIQMELCVAQVQWSLSWLKPMLWPISWAIVDARPSGFSLWSYNHYNIQVCNKIMCPRVRTSYSMWWRLPDWRPLSFHHTWQICWPARLCHPKNQCHCTQKIKNTIENIWAEITFVTLVTFSFVMEVSLHE